MRASVDGPAGAGDRSERHLRGWLGVALAVDASPDAKLLAYGLAEGGADWSTVRVRDLASGKDLPDEVRWMRFSSIAWTNDSKGFFYSRYPEPPKDKVLEAALSGHALYYHRVGTPQSQDALVYERKDLAGWIIDGEVTEDGRYLLVIDVRGRGKQEQPVLRGPRPRRRAEDRRAGQAAHEGQRCGVLAGRQQGFHAVPAVGQGRTEPQDRRRRSRQSCRRPRGKRSSPSARRRSRTSP